VFFLVFGASAAGKTFALGELCERVTDLAMHDFDEIGVPPDADTAWRHRADEEWVRRALDYQAQGTDLLLTGQTPLGELLAAPSAPRLNAISACLIDCDDATRVKRLQARGAGVARPNGGRSGEQLAWAAWMRSHAADPTWETDVIHDRTTDGEMQWSRWSSWRADDPRWRVHVIDASALPVDSVAAALANWIEEERALLRSGVHPLTGAIVDDSWQR
jgi:hypothetical protein